MKGMPDCIIPAAGLSTRMGAWKPGIGWDGATVIEKVASEALSAGCRTIVAGGHRYDELKEILKDLKAVVLVEIPEWRRGMDATIRGAFAYLKTDSAFVVPGDMPLITRADYIRLAKEWNGIFSRPVFGKIPGHPVVLGPSAIKKAALAPVGEPLRDALSGIAQEMLPWNHPGVIRDLDTPDDYKTLRPSASSSDE